MSTKTYSLRPFWDIDGYFVNIPGEPTFEPKHPDIYPGAEVEIKETLSIEEAKEKYGSSLDGKMYQVSMRKKEVYILEFTGKTSADIVQEYRNKFSLLGE